MSTQTLATLGVILGVVGPVAAAYLTARLSRAATRDAAIQEREAADASTAVESRRVDLVEWQGIVTELRTTITRQAEQITALLGRVEDMEVREDAERDLRRDHLAWDWQVLEELRAHGMSLPDPPPLTVPRTA